MQGYLARPEATAESLRDGWLYTGDIGEFAEDGFLYIRDRKKDLVIVGGYNVYPREVDEVLYLHADVAQAAAVGWPDSYRARSSAPSWCCGPTPARTRRRCWRIARPTWRATRCQR